MGYRSINKDIFLKLLNNIYKDSYKPATIRNSFKAIGLVYINAALVLTRLYNNVLPKRKPREKLPRLPP